MVAVELERRVRIENIYGMVSALQQLTIQSQKTVLHVEYWWTKQTLSASYEMSLFSPQVEDSEGTIQFDGEGYALVSRPIRWFPNISTVMFKFRTFSSGALLMYLATRDLVKICWSFMIKNVFASFLVGFQYSDHFLLTYYYSKESGMAV